MYQGKIIDFHAHIFPDKLAEKAAKSIGKFYDFPMSNNGSVNALLESSKSFNVEHFVVHSVATTRHQVESINDFIYEEMTRNSRFIGFMTLHPDMTREEIRFEVERNMARGLQGIKLHPDFQKFFVDDKEVYKLYEEVEGKLPILFHAGDKRYDFSAPERIANIAKEFPNLTCVAAHLGGYNRWHEYKYYENLDNVYFDSSSTSFFFDPKDNANLIDILGIDRVFFGTDFPMWTYRDEIERIEALPLSEDDFEKLYYLNAKKFLKL